MYRVSVWLRRSRISSKRVIYIKKPITKFAAREGFFILLFFFYLFLLVFSPGIILFFFFLLFWYPDLSIIALITRTLLFVNSREVYFPIAASSFPRFFAHVQRFKFLLGKKFSAVVVAFRNPRLCVWRSSMFLLFYFIYLFVFPFFKSLAIHVVVRSCFCSGFFLRRRKERKKLSC